MRFLNQSTITDKRVIVRTDFNVSLNPDHTIANDIRIKMALPSLKYLLANKNKLILISHLGSPKKYDSALSLSGVAKDLQGLLPNSKITLVKDFRKEAHLFASQNSDEILLLENIRFYKEEYKNSLSFARELAFLADTYVNDAFSVSHRIHASIVALPKLLPSFGGLLLLKEITALRRLLDNPKKPFVSVVGGAKTATKIKLLEKLLKLSDYLLLGGGLANTFLKAGGSEVGQSLYDRSALKQARHLMLKQGAKKAQVILPTDAVVKTGKNQCALKETYDIEPGDKILDIGPVTRLEFSRFLQDASTIVWNGPMGYFEDPNYQKGTAAIFEAIAQNPHAFSVVGGGETLASLKTKKHLDHISHISTGGGAMLAFLAEGTLPGIKALS